VNLEKENCFYELVKCVYLINKMKENPKNQKNEEVIEYCIDSLKEIPSKIISNVYKKRS